MKARATGPNGAQRGLEGRACGGAGGGFGLPVPGLVEGVVRNGLRLGGIERRGLIEVVWGGYLGDLFGIHPTEAHVEFCLRGPSGGMNQRR